MKAVITRRFGKQLIELAKRELLAIIAVGVVLAFLFSRSMAATLSPAEQIADATSDSIFTTQTITDVSSPAGGQALFYGQSMILFGIDIKGYDDYGRADFEQWKSTTGVKNLGTYLQINEANQVVISGVNAGTFKVWVKGLGSMTMNGTAFTFKTLRTLSKTITISANGTLTIKFNARSQIYSIATLPLEEESAEELDTAIPESLALLPNHSTIMLTNTLTAFRPLAIVVDTDGRQIPITPGLLIWSSNNNSIASVDQSGLVTAHQPGLVTINVQVKNTALTASTSLVVRRSTEPPLVDITPLAPVTDQSATVPTETNTFEDIAILPATQTGIISGFFSDLLNLKPSSATEPDNTSVTESPAAYTATSTPGLWTILVDGINQGLTYLSTWLNQTIDNIASYLIR
ncbi:MAG: Ig-like domain-containing protein [Patescibacteria group bacterium]